jgi:class 3 adenylate cyclase
VITFLLTDVEGSSRKWEQDSVAMRRALMLHDDIVAAGVERHGGRILTTHGEGDSLFAVFPLATGAAFAACEIQQMLNAQRWPNRLNLKVRMALHTGEAGGDFRGRVANRCARVRSLAAGGQVLTTAATAEVVQDELPQGSRLRFLGEFRLRDLKRPERLYLLLYPLPECWVTGSRLEV